MKAVIKVFDIHLTDTDEPATTVVFSGSLFYLWDKK